MTTPAMTAVVSSMIDAIGYDAEAGSIYVRFPNGKLYRYGPAAPAEYEAFANAPSIGKHLNAEIKPHMTCERME